MNNNKAFKLLNTFDATEFRRFCRFARNGYPTKDKYVLALLDKLEQHYPTFDSNDFERQRIYSAMYPGELLDMPKLRRLFSDFTLLIEDFWVFEHLDAKIKAKSLMAVYKQRNLTTYYEHLLTITEQRLQQQPIKNIDYYYEQYELHDATYQAEIGKQNRNISITPVQVLQHFDTYYVANKLRITCELVNRSNVLNINIDQQQINELLTVIEQPMYVNIILIKLYRLSLLMLLHPENESYYSQIRQLLNEVQQTITQDELKEVYVFAQNYCIRKINTGNSGYLIELFGLYQAQLNNGLLLENGYLSQWHYKNIVFVALRVNEFDWCLTFIENNERQLPVEERQNARIYNLAYYHFFKKEYKKTLRLLNTVELNDVFYFLDSRALLIKTYYELDETDALLNLLETFATNLKRNKQISTYQKTLYLNFVKAVKRLVKLPYSNKDSIAKFCAKIAQTEQIADRKWLLSHLPTPKTESR